MKISNLSWMMMAAMAFVSCSDKELPSTNGEETTDGTEYCLNAQIILPEISQTRADDPAQPTFSNGDAKEYNVKNSEIYFEFFDANFNRVGVRTPNVEWGAPNAEGQSVTRATADITISAQMTPKYLVVYLNVPNEEYANLRRLSMNDLKTGMIQYDNDGDVRPFRPGRNYLGDENSTALSTFFAKPVEFRKMMKERYANTTGSGSFLMMNSSYEEGGKIVRELNISDYLYLAGTTPNQKQKDGVDIYVERVVAKVNTNIALKSGAKAEFVKTTANGSLYKVPQMEGSQKADPIYVEFQGWQLNATNKSFVPLKDIGEAGQLTAWSAGKVAVHGLGRSYWAKDLNYSHDNGDYLHNSSFIPDAGATYPSTIRPALNYYSLANMEPLQFGDGSDLSQVDYCFENTMQGVAGSDNNLLETPAAITHVLVRAQYMKKSGDTYSYIPDTECIYRWGKTIYTESEVKEEALKLLKGTFGMSTLTAADITLGHNNNDFYSRNDVKSKIYCEKVAGKTYTSLTSDATITVPANGDVTAAVLGAANLYTFERGICYYTVPIKHFPEMGRGNTGYYGVVRNHWYQVTIEDIVEFGHPATPGDPNNPGDDPGKPIIPEDIQDDDYALNARININAWAKKPIQATIGGSQAWK